MRHFSLKQIRDGGNQKTEGPSNLMAASKNSTAPA
jgi:hypothetical protein